MSADNCSGPVRRARSGFGRSDDDAGHEAEEGREPSSRRGEWDLMPFTDIAGAVQISLSTHDNRLTGSAASSANAGHRNIGREGSDIDGHGCVGARFFKDTSISANRGALLGCCRSAVWGHFAGATRCADLVRVDKSCPGWSSTSWRRSGRSFPTRSQRSVDPSDPGGPPQPARHPCLVVNRGLTGLRGLSPR